MTMTMKKTTVATLMAPDDHDHKGNNNNNNGTGQP
jgi:hypothetical protein